MYRLLSIYFPVVSPKSLLPAASWSRPHPCRVSPASRLLLPAFVCHGAASPSLRLPCLCSSRWPPPSCSRLLLIVPPSPSPPAPLPAFACRAFAPPGRCLPAALECSSSCLHFAASLPCHFRSPEVHADEAEPPSALLLGHHSGGSRYEQRRWRWGGGD